MADPPWRRDVYRRFHRRALKRPHINKPLDNPFAAFAVTVLVAFVVAGSVIHLLEVSLRPIVSEVAHAQIRNHFTAVLESGMNRALLSHDPDYGDFVSVQRDETGDITALTTNLVLINQIRAETIENILAELEEVNISIVQIPLGSLFDTELFWAKGPVLQARAMTIGTVSVEFDSSFSDAGVNQTLHQIWLNSAVPVTVILPGGMLETTIKADFCVAETVIVGQVPGTFLQLEKTET